MYQHLPNTIMHLMVFEFHTVKHLRLTSIINPVFSQAALVVR